MRGNGRDGVKGNWIKGKLRESIKSKNVRLFLVGGHFEYETKKCMWYEVEKEGGGGRLNRGAFFRCCHIWADDWLTGEDGCLTLVPYRLVALVP
jgi:hypothetical protein